GKNFQAACQISKALSATTPQCGTRQSPVVGIGAKRNASSPQAKHSLVTALAVVLVPTQQP
ncbi:MAG: hypothetical protein O2931_16260, partial [Planctomycetota bacterium]|nr:hypothetical protein [Planctomycetota bacterium]